MPLLNGVDAARELQRPPKNEEHSADAPRQDQYVTGSLRAGVKGYVLKSQAAHGPSHAIQEVLSRSILSQPSISRAVVEAYLSKTELPGPLTSGNAKCFKLVAKGKSTRRLPHFWESA